MSSLGTWGRNYGRQTAFLNGARRSRVHLPMSGGSGDQRGLIRRVMTWVIRSIVGVFLLSVLMVVIYAFVPVPVTPLMMIRSVGGMGESKTGGWKKDWVSLDEISPKLQSAAIAAEDARFLAHNGFDLDAIDKAIRYNNKSTRRIRGGSTITQQVAKNVFLWPSRSWLRKGIEVYFTGLIELLWSKRRILEVYLNVVEFGEGVYGAEAASQMYFKKPAKNLNGNEAALLAAVLPNPHRFLVNKPSGYIRFRQGMIQRRMNAVTPLDP